MGAAPDPGCPRAQMGLQKCLRQPALSRYANSALVQTRGSLGATLVQDQKHFYELIKRTTVRFARLDPHAFVLFAANRCPVGAGSVVYHATGFDITGKRQVLSALYEGQLKREHWSFLTEKDTQKKISSIQVCCFLAYQFINLNLVQNVELLVDALYEYARRLCAVRLTQTQLTIFSAIALISAGTRFETD